MPLWSGTRICAAVARGTGEWVIGSRRSRDHVWCAAEGSSADDVRRGGEVGRHRVEQAGRPRA